MRIGVKGLAAGALTLAAMALGGGSVAQAQTGPVSNDAAAVQFSQQINSTDALRTGAYSKQLTFTLSTTQP